jgi:hypothetical protein
VVGWVVYMCTHISNYHSTHRQVLVRIAKRPADKSSIGSASWDRSFFLAVGYIPTELLYAEEPNEAFQAS